MLERAWGKGTLLHCRWECQLVQPLWKTGWSFLKKLKIELLYDPAISLLSMYQEKSMIWKDTCTPMLTAALLTLAKTEKQPKCPLTDEWIKKKRYIYTMEYYSVIKKNEIMPFAATCMDLEVTIPSEASQRRRDIIWHPLYVESKKIYTNELTKQKHSQT